jgi:biopolymer transport protein ExbD
MAMSSGNDSGSPMSEINVTPLVDVMLVLLIIFMITAPLMSHTITVKLPTANPKTADDNAKDKVDLAIKEDGSIYINDDKNAIPEEQLSEHLKTLLAQYPLGQPQLQIRAAKDTEFRIVRKALGDAKAIGWVHVAFMTTGKE